MLTRFVALLLLILLSPLFVIISILILFVDGLPVFFVQKRVGVNSTHFNMYKFRTMILETPNVATHLLVDPKQYITKIGQFLRKYSLDELPNLINMVKGEMCFVGPRPALFNQEDLMKLRIEAGVDKLLPGLTGLAQIAGRDELPLETKVMYDLEYKEKRSLFFDIKIILKTFTHTLLRKEKSH